MLRWAERNSQSRSSRAPASANQPPQPSLGEPGVLLSILTQRAPHIAQMSGARCAERYLALRILGADR